MNDLFTQILGASDSNSAVLAYLSYTESVYLHGTNRRFYQEFGYDSGLRRLYDICYDPLVAVYFMRLVQDITAVPWKVFPASNQNRSKALTHASFIKEVLNNVEILSYYEDLLLAYITGIIAHEFIWAVQGGGGSGKKKVLTKIKAIPPEFIIASGSGIGFRANLSSQTWIKEKPYKFSKFKYSQFLNTSELGDGVGKILHYLLKERERLKCLADLFAVRGTTPITVLKADNTVKPNTVKSAVKNIDKNEAWKAIALPPGLDLSAIELSGKYDIYVALLDTNERLILSLLAGENLVGSLGSGIKGAQEASTLRKTRALNLANKAIWHINQHVVKPLIDLNFGPQKSYPEFKLELPQLNTEVVASISDAIGVQNELGLKINPKWFESRYALDIMDLGVDE